MLVNAFIAWTPLHVINVLNTVVNYFPNEKNDLYLYDEFSGAEKLYPLLQQTHLFHHVSLIPHDEIGGTVEKMSSLLFNRQKFVSTDAYDHIFIQGENYFAKLLYGQSRKKNPEVKLHYIEDGLGAYVGSPVIRNDNRGNRLVKQLNRHSIFHAAIESFYVYEPNLVTVKEKGDYFPLPKLTDDNPALSIVKQVFSLKTSVSMIHDCVIYFDQPFLADGFSIDEGALMQELQVMIPDEKLIVKYHPRSPQDKYGPVHKLETNLPWELYCLNQTMENVSFLSVATTASFTPYMMFGIDLPVIMLAEYYLEWNRKNNGNQRTITMLENILSFSNVFKEQTGATIHMPKSMTELAQVLSEKKRGEESFVTY